MFNYKKDRFVIGNKNTGNQKFEIKLRSFEKYIIT